MTTRKASANDPVDPPDEEPLTEQDLPDPAESDPVEDDPSQEQAAPGTGPRYPGDPNTYDDPENPARSGF